jgi:hypothetical protein
MGWARAALGLAAVLAAGGFLVSGGSGADPETPAGLADMPPPFLGTATVGSGGLTAAVDAYGDVVDLRANPAGTALIDNPADRQAAGTVPSDTGIVPRIAIGGGPPLPLWRAKRVAQRYLPGTNVVVTVADFPGARVVLTEAASPQSLALRMRVRARPGRREAGWASVAVEPPVRCHRASAGNSLDLVCGVVPRGARRAPTKVIEAAASRDRRWLRHARPLAGSAPRWAARMYARSLLVLRASTDRRSGAVAAGARDGWAHVWPRDAATAAMAFAAAGYRAEAGRVARFLLGLRLDEAARFRGDGGLVAGRAAQGDAIGWVGAAARAAGVVSGRHAARMLSGSQPVRWRGRADYQEGDPGDFLGNALASGLPAGRVTKEFEEGGGLVREAGRGGGLDSAAAWAVRPFPRPALREAARRTLLRLGAKSSRYGLLPGEGWRGGEDPWSAPTAWSAWSLATLARLNRSPAEAAADRRLALRLLATLRRAATPAGALPERVGASTGVPRSTTPLTWSHAFAILALQELWPSR